VPPDGHGRMTQQQGCCNVAEHAAAGAIIACAPSSGCSSNTCTIHESCVIERVGAGLLLLLLLPNIWVAVAVVPTGTL
jgi:hypothetical protein